MNTYEGRGLPDHPRIAVVANDAIGNFVVATPLLQMLRAELQPEFIHYYGGKRTAELQAASDLFEWHFPLHGTELATSAATAQGPYDLVVNVENSALARSFTAQIAGDAAVCGPCDGLDFPADLHGDLFRDKAWIAKDLTTRFPFLKSGFIGEIYARLAYLTSDLPRYRVPTVPVEHDFDILIATSASLPEKLWPRAKWESTLIALASQGLKVGLIGAKPKEQGQHWKGADDETLMVEQGLVHDARGRWTLPEVVGALSSTGSVLTLDNGIMHLASATERPTIGLFRHGIHRLWAPPFGNVKVLTAGPDRSVADIEVDSVLEALGGV